MKNTGDKGVVISIRGLVQKVGKRTVLNGVDLDLYRGECLGVFGLRGTGKTTLLHAALGVDRIKSGNIEIWGQNIAKSQAYKKKLGLVTQQPSLFADLNVAENLDLFRVIKKAPFERLEDVIQRLQLEDYLHEALPSLQVGVYQRVALACALLNRPEILIIDEIIRDIDLESRGIILQVLEAYLEEGNSCLCGFSNMEHVHYLDRVAWLDDGSIHIYSPDEAENLWRELNAVIPKKRGEQDA
ncbi:MAG: ATP-binding cassette domain-containing protein [Syntrophomonas sp.]|nr:ATP-binding cassette domain-containing protein [Syntrophomonas sp.]